MKYPFKPLIINAAFFAIAGLASCKKENSVTTVDTTVIQAAVSQTQSIAVAASTSTAGDSIYVTNTCAVHSHRDTIAFGDLSSSITGYLTANYPGYTFQKGFKISDATGTLEGYVVIIIYNGNPVGLKFDAGGVFVKVLEQREGGDLLGHGWHAGGCFENRDGMHRDTVALGSLPTAILTYFSTNYSSDTLIRASKTRDGSYIVLSKNGNLYATVFNSSGSFVNRLALPEPSGRGNAIDQSALPSNALNYLSSTYPGYVFEKAFSITFNNVIQGYCVVIDANNTKYAIQFDASGAFIRSKTIR